MKKIIALYRRAETGKTSTLNLLIELLDKNEKAEENRLTEEYLYLMVVRKLP